MRQFEALSMLARLSTQSADCARLVPCAFQKRWVSSGAPCRWLQLHQHPRLQPTCWRHRPLSTIASGSKEREGLLQWVGPENREEVARVLEVAEQASVRWEVTWTDFLSPPVAADAVSALSHRADVLVLPWGGYGSAERCRQDTSTPRMPRALRLLHALSPPLACV